METLELKHVVCYLPYGLKFATLNDDTEKYYINEERHILECGGLNGVANICMAKYSRPIYRIILRPLSYLKNSDFTDLYIDLCGAYNGVIINDIIDNKRDTSFISYYYIERLLQNHFDIFGLIEKKLAIDINTL